MKTVYKLDESDITHVLAKSFGCAEDRIQLSVQANEDWSECEVSVYVDCDSEFVNERVRLMVE